MGKNKIIFGGEVQIDLTNDTATEEKVLSGFTFHGADGDIHTGTCEFDVDSSEATALVGEVLAGRTFGKGGALLEGTAPNNGGVSGVISTKAGQYTVPQGFHDGSGKVQISAAEQAKIIAGNIKSGVVILGVTGTYTGASISAQSKTVTPAKTAFDVAPDSGYDYLSGVHVNAIPYSETPNAAGGTTVTIG